MMRSWVLLAVLGGAQAADQRLTYYSDIDRTSQPYRVYVPAIYNGAHPVPLVIAMHGTGGNENSLFDEPAYQEGGLRAAADKHGVIVASPFGRNITEYRGSGENDVFRVLEAVRRQWLIDEDRIYLTGHSMGGTGSAYLALHHPDIFAAAAPLAAAYSFPWLARNASILPFLWIGGAQDAEFYHRGVAAGVDRMRKFGAPVTLEILPGEGHNGPVKNFDRVFEWLLRHQRDPHPRRYVFEVDTPLHGCAWWTCVTRIAEPGRMASIQAEAPGGNTVYFRVENVAEFTFAPDAFFLDTTRPMLVHINGNAVWSAPVPYTSELVLTSGWAGHLKTKLPQPLAMWRVNQVAVAPEQLDMLGAEKRLANWITDAMRRATGAHIALWGGWAYRGLPIPKGPVDIVDLIQCSRPFDQYLVIVRLSGRDIIEILDANVPHPKKDRPLGIDSPGASRLLQISGAKYTFDASKPDGHKIMSTGIDPSRMYTVALEGQAVERETVLLAGRFRKLDYHTTGIPFTLALYGHAAKLERIEAKAEGRVVEVK